MIRILLVDDHPAVMEGTKFMLEDCGEFEVETTHHANSALELIRNRDYDLLLFDLHMPQMNGLELAKAAIAARSDSVILLYTGFDILPHFNLLAEAGVSGFISKTATKEELMTSIRCAIRGETIIPSSLFRELRREARPIQHMDRNAEADKTPVLIQKEIDILREVAKGKSNKEIAEKGLMSQRSLEYCLTQIFQKLHVKSRIEAVAKSKQFGFLIGDDFL